jgi:hypothetical protein
MNNDQAKQVPLVELLDEVPADVRIGVEDGEGWQAGTTWHPIGQLCHEAAAELRRLHADVEELDGLRDRLADLLSRTAVALKGPEPPLTRWDWSDLPERAMRLHTEVQGWIPVAERLPKPGQYVLVVFRYSTGKQVVIRAMHAPRHTLSEDDYGEFVTEGADYDEATDTTYWPEGWYECNENEETHWQVHEKVTHWMPLPETPSVGEKPDAA